MSRGGERLLMACARQDIRARGRGYRPRRNADMALMAWAMLQDEALGVPPSIREYMVAIDATSTSQAAYWRDALLRHGWLEIPQALLSRGVGPGQARRHIVSAAGRQRLVELGEGGA